MDPQHLSTTTMLFAAFGGIATELVAFWLLYERQKNNLNMKGAFWHIIQTFVGSLIIIASALVIRFTGFMEIDPILGMAFGVVLFWASWSIIGSSLGILLESTPAGLDLEAAMGELRGLEGVEDVHHVHAWSLTSGRNVFSAHLRVRSLAEDGARVLREATDHLKERHGIYFSTLQIEEECLAAERGAEAIDITAGADRIEATAGASSGHSSHAS
jgi:cobalt-zinc-cadmium efflux system protein